VDRRADVGTPGTLGTLGTLSTLGMHDSRQQPSTGATVTGHSVQGDGVRVRIGRCEWCQVDDLKLRGGR